MFRDVKIPKKPYIAPTFEVLDIGAAKAQFDAKTTSRDGDARQMLPVIEKRLRNLRKGNPRQIRRDSTWIVPLIRKVDS